MSRSSAVAGILDPYGGLRVVVDQDNKFRHHVRCDEMLFVVPGLRVHEPVPWHKIPFVISSVEQHIAEWVRTRNDPDALEATPVKMYLIRCRPTVNKRATNTEHVVFG